MMNVLNSLIFVCILVSVNAQLASTVSVNVSTGCSNSPCKNRALCTDTANGYTCRCASGFFGVNCESEIDECASAPCKNGGLCFDQFNTYACVCKTGFTGVDCETNIDDCKNSLCQNNGTCIDGVNAYTCTCLHGYSGDQCQTRIDVDDCYSNPCLNGGTCFDGNFTYTCQCTDYYKGTNCQTACHSVKADIVMLLDTSGSVGNQNFQKLKKFTQSVAKAFTIGPDNVHMSVVTFASAAHKQFGLNQYLTQSSLLNAINSIHYHSGGTNTGAALDFILHHIFTNSGGDRKDAPNIAVVLTDGKSSNSSFTSKEAQLVHRSGITTVAIGIGRHKIQELKTIASNNSLAFHVPNFDALHTIQGLLDHGICKAHLAHTTSYPTPNILIPVKCEDKIIDCYQYGITACDSFRQWASDNCPKYCQFCRETTSSISTTIQPIILG